MTSQKTKTGAQLIAAITADWDEDDIEPDARERDLLERAAYAADQVVSLEKTVAREGRTYRDKDGVVRPSPLLAEIRQQELVIARCLGGISAGPDRQVDPAKSRAGKASAAARGVGNYRGAIMRPVS